MARAASYTVQKYRSRIQRASWMPSASSTGCSSSRERTDFILGELFPGPMAKIRPWVRRLPAPKGMRARIPGRAIPDSASGRR